MTTGNNIVTYNTALVWNTGPAYFFKNFGLVPSKSFLVNFLEGPITNYLQATEVLVLSVSYTKVG